MRRTIEQRLEAIQEDNSTKLEKMINESSFTAQKAREEVTNALKQFSESTVNTLKDMVNPDTGKKYTEGDIYGIVENRTSTGGDPHWKAMSPTERKAAVEYLNQVIQARRREATESAPEPPPPDAMSIMREMRGTMTPKLSCCLTNLKRLNGERRAMRR